MVDVDVYTIDDVDYILVEELVISGSSYLYLSNVNDKNDIIFKKRNKEDKDVLMSLENDEEAKTVALVFAKKFFGIK